MNELEHLLRKYHKIILWGEHGSGKTRFVQYCLYKWQKKDYCHVNYNIDLSTTLNDIKYIDYLDMENSASISDISKYNFLNSLLIIDNMCFSSNVQNDIKELSKVKANIIVITTSFIDTDTFYSYELPPLSDDDLSSIFKTESNIEGSISCLEQVFDKTWRNPLFISLIARQCKHEKIGAGTLDNILKHLEQPNKNLKLQKFKHPSNNVPVNFMGHVKAIYNEILNNYRVGGKKVNDKKVNDKKVNDKKDFVEQLKYLCCFGCSPIPLNFISCVFPHYNKSTYDKLSQLGLIEYSDEMVQVPFLIFCAVWETEKFEPATKDFQCLCNKLCFFLMQYNVALSVPYLSSLLLSFAQNLYGRVPVTYNPNQKKNSKNFEQWQELLSLIFTYYNQAGAFHLSEKTASLIRYTEKTKNRHNRLDKDLLHLTNCISLYPTLSADDIAGTIDEILLSLCKDSVKDSDFPLDIASLLIGSFDAVIKHYCSLFFSYVSESGGSIKEAEQHLAKILGILLSKALNMRQPLSKLNINLEETLSYYKGCHYLMTLPIIPSEYLCKCCSGIKLWKNTNYRIRGVSFTIFMYNFYLFENIYSNYTWVVSDLLPQFSPIIMAEIKYLSDQIQSCKLIPHETSYICLCCYISAALVQYTFLSEEHQNFSFDFYSTCLKELISRSILSKKDIDTAMTCIDKISAITKQNKND